MTAVLCLLGAPHAIAEDEAPWRALLVSGGGSPTSNAIAHEKNILFVQRTLAGLGMRKNDMPAYVSVGAEPFPDTSYVSSLPQERWELAVLDRLFGRGGIDLAYRHHAVTDVAGPARRGDILQAIRTGQSKLDAGETLLLYGTDHGQRGENGLSENALVLWGSDRLTVADMQRALDEGKGAGRVVLVMAQCYSGAFGGVMYKAGTKVMSQQDRCGFFATTGDREAAGCTPEIDETEYDDYSTRLFSALGGNDRVGRPVPGADYNGNGRVSFAEAHAHAVSSEETIDVPVKTSELYLEEIGLPATAAWLPSLAAAPIEDRAAWENLAKRLGLSPGDPRSPVDAGLRSAAKRLASLQRERDRLDVELQSYEEELRESLLQRWPLLDTPYHPQFAATLKNGPAIQSFLMKNRAYDRWQSAMTRFGALDADLLAAQVQQAWWMRAERLAKYIRRLAAVAQSPHLAPASVRLRTCEASEPGK